MLHAGGRGDARRSYCSVSTDLRIYGLAGWVQPRRQGPAADLGSASGEGGLVLQSAKVACTTGAGRDAGLVARVQSAVTTPRLLIYGSAEVVGFGGHELVAAAADLERVSECRPFSVRPV
jgi:hypothetical protein